MKETLRLAVWSGPRNISTALMRSWGNRSDTHVCDEPLYANYLVATGLPHPGAAEIIASQDANWRAVTAELCAPGPYGPKGDKRIYFQKHMAHHLRPEIGRRWLGDLTHVFLIRDPREMLLSLAKVTPNPVTSDTGLPQQAELYRSLCRAGQKPPVLDARDILSHPRELLEQLCAAVEVPFEEAMLAWPAGPRVTDGVWARHWYASVEESTGFQAWRPRDGVLSAGLEPVLEACQEPYRLLHENRLA